MFKLKRLSSVPIVVSHSHRAMSEWEFISSRLTPYPEKHGGTLVHLLLLELAVDDVPINAMIFPSFPCFGVPKRA